jgi:hypothetical protein
MTATKVNNSQAAHNSQRAKASLVVFNAVLCCFSANDNLEFFAIASYRIGSAVTGRPDVMV